MKKIILKENNGGGLSIELYINGTIEQVVTGLEFGEPLTISDIIGIGETWDARDASNGYDYYGNTLGDKREDGEELTAEDMVDDSDWTKEIATYDEENGIFSVVVDELGNAGKKLLNIL